MFITSRSLYITNSWRLTPSRLSSLLHNVTHTTTIRFNSNSQSRWVQRSKNDVYTREAKLKNWRSRAAFKLMEIDDKFKLFNKDIKQNVLDLGFAPGSWSQVARKRTNSKSIIMGVDILPCKPIDGVHALQANILSKTTHNMIRLFFNEKFNLNEEDKLNEKLGYLDKPYMNGKSDDLEKIYPVNIIISDMYVPYPKDFENSNNSSNLTNMPYYRLMNTSGVAIRDHLRSVDLCDAALITAIDLLRPNGSFVCKLYTGREEHLFKKRLHKVFKKVYKFKPDSSRSMSKEVYYVGLEKKISIDKIDVFAT
ncbi:similar to Saccharomyces cerevisiae YGL136C MRM2 Mitochondrial 2' O-ribose methyltransferase, required for methylation of U(2791) in 21S rRNA [Maudiozyma saulgeensis]|uniref:rRNA methyltransferase 2, mitochondrial n=1 Tax=Maudiozyma saulgeensis TaxID=1789683 RepID=A0A1X7R0A5_9SACH|nr:similar to Saccharomyces cerevisiae YGL136C MRM2 Mitochondrial 2' O-ribose methyltransferase, required for methylation of U(2791) in 21S rRNA [Kazachstania saulgeensis]